MGVPYLRKMQSADLKSTRAQKWEYWNDYSPEGIEKFAQENPFTQERVVARRESPSKGATEASEDATEYVRYGTISSLFVEEDNDSHTTMSEKRETTSQRSSETAMTPSQAQDQQSDGQNNPMSPRLVTAEGHTVLDLRAIE